MDSNCPGERSGETVKYYFKLVWFQKLKLVSLFCIMKNIFSGGAWFGWAAGNCGYTVNCGSLQISGFTLGVIFPLKRHLPMF